MKRLYILKFKIIIIFNILSFLSNLKKKLLSICGKYEMGFHFTYEEMSLLY